VGRKTKKNKLQRKEFENKFKDLEKEYKETLTVLKNIQEDIGELELDMEDKKYRITETQDTLFIAAMYHWDLVEMMQKQINTETFEEDEETIITNSQEIEEEAHKSKRCGYCNKRGSKPCKGPCDMCPKGMALDGKVHTKQCIKGHDGTRDCSCPVYKYINFKYKNA
jgi:hypothetical protein